MTQCIGPHLVRASNLANVGHVKKTGGRLETRAWLRGSLQSLEQDERLLHPLTHFIHFIQYAIHWVPNMLSCFSPPAPPPPGPWVCVDAFSWSTSRPPLLLPHTLAVPTLLASWYSTIQLQHTLPPLLSPPQGINNDSICGVTTPGAILPILPRHCQCIPHIKPSPILKLQ